MATNIDKSLYQAPLGMDSMDEEPEFEIEIEDPESVRIGMPGLEIEIEPDEESEDDFAANLAEYVSEDVLEELASELIDAYEDDNSSRIANVVPTGDCEDMSLTFKSAAEAKRLPSSTI